MKNTIASIQHQSKQLAVAEGKAYQLGLTRETDRLPQIFSEIGRINYDTDGVVFDRLIPHERGSGRPF